MRNGISSGLVASQREEKMSGGMQRPWTIERLEKWGAGLAQEGNPIGLDLLEIVSAWEKDRAAADRASAELQRVDGILDTAGVPAMGCVMLHSPAGRVRWLVERRDELRTVLRDLYDAQNGPPLERGREKWEDAMRLAAAVLEDGNE